MSSRFGEVIFTINEGETISKSNAVTDFPVEEGANISDNVDPDPSIISFTGIVQGDGAVEKLQLLRRYSDNGEMQTYVGRNAFGNMVIESFDTIHDNTIKGGFIFSITLKQITIAVQQVIQIDFTKVPRPKIKETETAGSQQTQTQADPNTFNEIQTQINALLMQ